jgi:signal transduction histidine kinase
MRPWFKQRFGMIWWIAQHDSTAFAELLSGTFLLAMRGLMLLFAPQGVLPLDVQFRLYPITEYGWGIYIMFCGLLQIMLAGSRYSMARLLLKVAIMSGFVVLSVAYGLEDRIFSLGMLSFITLGLFYFALMTRIFVDRRRKTPSLEEKLNATHSH